MNSEWNVLMNLLNRSA